MFCQLKVSRDKSTIIGQHLEEQKRAHRTVKAGPILESKVMHAIFQKKGAIKY